MTGSLHRGDYVLATKYSDGDPRDHFCVGFFRGMLVDWDGRVTDRYLVEDISGRLFRESGFRRCERIQRRTGDILVAAFPLIGNRPGRSLWYWRRHLRELQALVCQRARRMAE
jgi:signal peptidase I